MRYSLQRYRHFIRKQCATFYKTTRASGRSYIHYTLHNNCYRDKSYTTKTQYMKKSLLYVAMREPTIPIICPPTIAALAVDIKQIGYSNHYNIAPVAQAGESRKQRYQIDGISAKNVHNHWILHKNIICMHIRTR